MDPGILLVNLGTPETPTPGAVRRYLREFLGDRRVVPLPRLLWLPLLYAGVSTLRARRVAKSYQSVWGEDGSPLLVYTRNLARKLGARGWKVAVGMCYGRPDLAAGLETLREQGVGQVFILPLYPQYSQTTTAAVFDRVSRIFAGWVHLPALYFLNGYHAEPAYIGAVAERIAAFWRVHGRAERLLMSFHGLPEKSRRQGDPYYDQCLTSARLIADALALGDSDWQVVFQSRFGPARWLQPYCVDVLRALPEQGVRSVDVVCPGFAVDCLETLEEIACVNREVFLQSGGERYHYIPALNDDEVHVTLLTGLIRSRIQME